MWGSVAEPPGVEGLSSTYGVLTYKVTPSIVAVKQKLPHCGIFIIQPESPGRIRRSRGAAPSLFPTLYGDSRLVRGRMFSKA